MVTQTTRGLPLHPGEDREPRPLRLRLANLNESDWDHALAVSPGGGHVYQSFAWGEHKRRHGWEPLRVLLLRGDEVVGCAQVLLRRISPLGRLAYCPKGPWIDWNNRAHVQVFFESLEGMLRARGVFFIRVEPEVLEAQREVQTRMLLAGFQFGRWNQQFKTTMFLDLTPSEEELLTAMKGGTRRNVRLSARHGVRVVEDNSIEARHRFFAMYQRTQQRDGFFMRPRAYILDGWDALIRANQGHLFFATVEGRELAGMFVATFAAKCWYKDGASENEGRNLMPTYALQWEVMRWGKARGLTTYDMVAIPDPKDLDDPNHSMHGLYRFKSGFGGEVKEFTREFIRSYKPRIGQLWYETEPLTYRMYKKLRKDVYY